MNTDQCGHTESLRNAIRKGIEACGAMAATLVLTLLLPQPAHSSEIVLDWVQFLEPPASLFGNARGHAVAVDSSGNIYLAGKVRDFVDIDPGPGEVVIEGTNVDDAFVAKYTPDGDFVWGHALNSVVPDSLTSTAVSGIAVDPDDNVVFVGAFSGTLDVDPGPDEHLLTAWLNPPNDAVMTYVVKWDNDGSLVWGVAHEGFGRTYANDVDIDPSGNIYVCGTSNGSTDLDPGPGEATGETSPFHDTYVQKFDPDGVMLWAHIVETSWMAEAHAVELDESANVYVAGFFGSDADFDSGPGEVLATTNGVEDVYVQKLDTNGNHLWVRTFGGAQRDKGFDLARSRLGDLCVVGTFEGSIDLDPGPGTQLAVTTAPQAMFVVVLDASGGFKLGYSLNTTPMSLSRLFIVADEEMAVDYDSTGSLYVSGYFEGTQDFDPGPGIFEHSTNNRDVFIQKFDKDYNLVLAKHFEAQSDVGSGRVEDILVLPDDRFVLAGIGGPDVDWDPSSGTSVGNFTFAKFSPVHPPTIEIGVPQISNSVGGPIQFQLNYIGADTVSLTVGDVVLNATGTAFAAISVTDGATSAPKVILNAVTGDGRLGISILPGTAVNEFGDPAGPAGPSTQVRVEDATPAMPLGSNGTLVNGLLLVAGGVAVILRRKQITRMLS